MKYDHHALTSFDWLPENEDTHAANHGVPFGIAVLVFLDSRRVERQDKRRDYGERRWNTFGLVDGIHLDVTFTMRGSIGWIISARSAHRKERAIYDAQ